MKRILFLAVFCLFIHSSVFAVGRPNFWGFKPHPQITVKKYIKRKRPPAATPEPASMLLLAMGGVTAFGIKKIVKKK